ncbi:MAG: hypothetical protein ACRCUY_09075 [Thermoguttaceae bacterium]
MKHLNFSILSFFLMAFSTYVAGAVYAVEKNAIQIHSIEVGTEGIYKNGHWTQVVVEFSILGDQKPIRLGVSTFDSDGTPVTYWTPLEMETDESNLSSITQVKRFCEEVYVKFGRQKGSMTILFEYANGDILSEKQLTPAGRPGSSASQESTGLSVRFNEPVPSEKPVILFFGDENTGVQGAIAELSLRENRRPLLVKVTSLSKIPQHGFALEAIERIVLTTTEPQVFAGFTAKSTPVLAMIDWLRSGGKMLFVAGKDSAPLLESGKSDQENGVLSPFLPGKFERMAELRQVTGSPLETYIESKRTIVMNGTPDAPYLQMPKFTNPHGIVLAHDGDLPLISRTAFGFGTLTYFGGDLSGKPLSSWSDRVELVRHLLGWKKDRRTPTQRGIGMIQLGYHDLSGQIRSALDQFAGVWIVPFSVILIFLATYWLVVSIFDWFFVHKVLKNPSLTWITFPTWILLFCTLSYFLSASGRPNQLLVNQLVIRDFDAQAKRSCLWMNVYSPVDARYSFQSSFDLFSWNGLPGSGLGGMAPKTISPNLWNVGEEQFFERCNNDPNMGKLRNAHIESRLNDVILPNNRMMRVPAAPDFVHVPIPVRSTKSFFGQSTGNGDENSQKNKINEKDYFTEINPIIAQIADEKGIPVGSLQYGKTGKILKNTLLIYGDWGVQLGMLEPGQKIDIDKDTPRIDLRDLLYPKEVFEKESLRHLASYNAQSTDLNYIVRVMSIFTILGGYETVGLFNSFRSSLDMSDILSADRAILIAEVSDISETESAAETSIQDHFVNINRENTNRENGTTPQLVSTRTEIWRCVLPIRLTALSPRLKQEQKSISGDALETPIAPAEYDLNRR